MMILRALTLSLVVTLARAMQINIIGGSQVPESNTDFRFIASLQHKNFNGKFKHYCGGALVGPLWVITAAHCVKYGGPDLVRIGSYNTDEGGHVRTVAQIITHPDFYSTKQDDIALLKLNAPVVGSIIKIDMDGRWGSDGSSVVSIGWGYTQQYSGTIMKNLRMVDLVVISNEACEKQYPGSINKGHLCTWGEWNPHTGQRNDQCSGDSGGPTFHYNRATGEVVLVALTSWGKGCGRRDYSGVSTRLSYYGSFISRYVRGKRRKDPTPQPTDEPTGRPSRTPTQRPTRYPTDSPTARPSRYPTSYPTRRPTR